MGHGLHMKAHRKGQDRIIKALLLFSFFIRLAGGAGAADLRPFSSDGCSLFPDGTIEDRARWCDCCFVHDIAYWQGGTAADREKADDALRDCVLARTGDKVLAESMRLGVRAGGHPVSVMWYRWGYGWELGRGYKPLTDAEKLKAEALLSEYRKNRPSGYCGATTAKSTAAV
ncbi:MAG: hypothetical protein A3J79_09195, partial [Elusimicrobia bacterium RIFOXYB2_FULL_62_6]